MHESGERRAWDAILQGEIAAEVEPSATGEVADAWRAAHDAARWHAAPDRGAPPSLESLEAFCGASAAAREAAILACAWGVRAAVLALDRDALGRYATLIERLALDPSSELAAAWVAAARAWERLAAGEPVAADQIAIEAGALARQTDARPMVIEAAAIRALAAQCADTPETGVATARVALRMARTEELPQWQYLTAIVLARARRLSGHPHLAVRILRAVQKVAPAPWRGWVALELVLAGDSGASSELGVEPRAWASRAGVRDWATPCAAALAGVLCARRAADPSAGAALHACAAAWGPLRSDLLAVLAAFDPQLPDAGVPSDVIEWRRCRTRALPPRLSGVGLCGQGSEGERSRVHLVVGPEVPPQRFLAGPAGSGLLALDAATPRVEATIAALAVAGPAGLEAPALFREVYGFPYDAAVHQAALKVLVHRVRAHVAKVATVVRRAGCIVLVPERAFVVVEANVDRPLESRVLATIARLERVSARQAAEALQVPARTVQAALHALVEEGAVVPARDGKHVVYGVEDTSFSEPTRW